jgi:hypothetical protein
MQCSNSKRDVSNVRPFSQVKFLGKVSGTMLSWDFPQDDDSNEQNTNPSIKSNEEHLIIIERKRDYSVLNERRRIGID